MLTERGEWLTFTCTNDKCPIPPAKTASQVILQVLMTCITPDELEEIGFYAPELYFLQHVRIRLA